MTFETAGAIALTTLGVGAAVAGFLWTMGRIARPWTNHAARDAADEARDEATAPLAGLSANDCRSFEAKARAGAGHDAPEARRHADRKALHAMETRLRGDCAAMEIRVLRAVDAMEVRLGARIERLETRLVAAMRSSASPHG